MPRSGALSGKRIKGGKLHREEASEGGLFASSREGSGLTLKRFAKVVYAARVIARRIENDAKPPAGLALSCELPRRERNLGQPKGSGFQHGNKV